MEKIGVDTALAIFLVATAVVLITGLMVTVTQQAAFANPTPTNPKKVTICHEENPDNRKTQTIGAPAVAAHVRNSGDSIGSCQPVD